MQRYSTLMDNYSPPAIDMRNIRPRKYRLPGEFSFAMMDTRTGSIRPIRPLGIKTRKERLYDMSCRIVRIKTTIDRLERINAETDWGAAKAAEELQKRQQGLAPEYRKDLSDDELLELYGHARKLEEMEREPRRSAISSLMDELEQLSPKHDLLRARIYKSKEKAS